jgi:hypothetical protein
MTEPSVSFAGNLTDQPEVRYTEGGIARAMFRVAVSGRREQEASFFTVIVGGTRPSMPRSPCRRAAGSWSWVGFSSGAGPLRMAAPARPWRSWPRSWAEPAVGDGDDDQDHEESGSVASSTDATVRDAGEGPGACRRSAPSCLCC